MTLCYWLQTRGFSPKGTPFDCVFSAGWQKLMERNDKPIFRELNPFLGGSQGLGPSVLMSFFRSLEKNQGAKTKIRELSATAPLTTPWITHIFYPFSSRAIEYFVALPEAACSKRGQNFRERPFKRRSVSRLRSLKFESARLNTFSERKIVWSNGGHKFSLYYTKNYFWWLPTWKLM